MKQFYLIIGFLITLNSYGQNNNDCYDANSYLVNAYSHVKESYDSNNISHLKYYANRSLEAFKLAINALENCDCEAALDLSNKSIELLAKVDPVETFEDGRFFIKRARELSKKSVIEIDKCAYAKASYEDTETNKKAELSDLQKQQEDLRKQQEALKLKAATIKNKLALQEEKALALKKEQLMISYKTDIDTHVKTYNNTLKMYGCDVIPLEAIESTINISEKRSEDIKQYYLDQLKALTTAYLSRLDACQQ